MLKGAEIRYYVRNLERKKLTEKLYFSFFNQTISLNIQPFYLLLITVSQYLPWSLQFLTLSFLPPY